MNLTIVIDLENTYYENNKQYLADLSDEFKIKVVDRNVVNEYDKEKCVVITDSKDWQKYWEGFAIIGVEHDSIRLNMQYLSDTLEGVNCQYIKMVYGRKMSLPIIIASTERLIIREVSVKDVKALYHLYDDVENVRYISPISDIETFAEETEAYIENMYGFFGYGLWVIEHKECGRLIGRVGIEHREIGGQVYHELGYFIEGEYQKQGYAYEASKAVLEWAKNNYIDEIIAYVNEKNTPSIRLAEKLGFSLCQSIMDGDERFLLFTL